MFCVTFCSSFGNWWKKSHFAALGKTATQTLGNRGDPNWNHSAIYCTCLSLALVYFYTNSGG